MTPAPPRRLVLLAGPSGSGKSRLAHASNATVVRLDDFYRADTEPGLPRTLGIIDWDDVATWRLDDAVAALTELVETGHAQVPVYELSLNAPVGTQHVACPEGGVIVAEGIFAPEMLAATRAAGLAPRGIWLQRPTALTFALRLRRDLAEHRKPPAVLVRRGVRLALAERALRRRVLAAGFRPLSMRAASALLASVESPAAKLHNSEEEPDD